MFRYKLKLWMGEHCYTCLQWCEEERCATAFGNRYFGCSRTCAQCVATCFEDRELVAGEASAVALAAVPFIMEPDQESASERHMVRVYIRTADANRLREQGRADLKQFRSLGVRVKQRITQVFFACHVS